MRVQSKYFLSAILVLTFMLAVLGFSIASAQSVVMLPGLYDHDNPRIIYSPQWTLKLDDRAYGGSQAKTIIYNKSASFTFRGDQLVVIYTKSPDSGVFQVSIDGVIYEFDAYSETRQFQTQWASPRLSSEDHAVAIQKRNDDGKSIYLDGLKIKNTIFVLSGESIQSKCIDIAMAGSTCIVKSGIYRERITADKPISLICQGTCKVTGGAEIRANRVTLRGFELTSRGIMLKGKFIRVEHNFIHDLTSETGILFYEAMGTSNVIIRKNTIVRANNACIQLAGEDHLVQGNDCSATKQPLYGDADCFRYFGGNHVFRGNFCHDIWYGASGYNMEAGDYINDAHIDCFQTWNWESRGGAGHDILFERNFCDLPDQGEEAQAKGVQSEGLTSDGSIDLSGDFPCRNLTFRNNVVHSNLLGIFKYCQDITLLYNTFVGDADVFSGGLHLLSLKGTNTIRYNIFVDQDDGAFTSYSSGTRATVLAGYNFIYSSQGVPDGSPQPGDIWDINPQFVDRAGGNYHLQPGSPACGWGAFPCSIP